MSATYAAGKAVSADVDADVHVLGRVEIGNPPKSGKFVFLVAMAPPDAGLIDEKHIERIHPYLDLLLPEGPQGVADDFVSGLPVCGPQTIVGRGTDASGLDW